jgi:hypothetical protein
VPPANNREGAVIKIAIIGAGNVGRALGQLLEPYALLWIHLALRRGFGLLRSQS